MENDAADQLHVEVPHSGRTNAGLPYDCESLRQDLIEHCTFESLSFLFVGRVSDCALDLLFKTSGTGAQLVIRQSLHRRFEGVNLFHQRQDRFQEPLIAATKKFSEKFIETHN